MIIKLDNPRAWRTYCGGKKLDELEGKENPKISHFPEEWIISCVTANNGSHSLGPEEGLSHALESGITLKSIIEEDPRRMLGSTHYKKYGSTPGVLIKLIDSAERLSVQVHPNKEKARSLFNSQFGKTECWHILGGDDPNIYIGFKEGVTRDEWKNYFDVQDISGMLSCLHHVKAKIGDTFLIRGGVPHAIGKDTFLMEIQEPTDYTIRVERTTPSGLVIDDILCHQGLGFYKMFDCFDYNGTSEEELFKTALCVKNIISSNIGYELSSIISYDMTDCFSMESLKLKKGYQYKLSSAKSFIGLYVMNGKGFIDDESYKGGEQLFISASNDEALISAKEDSLIYIFHGPKV